MECFYRIGAGLCASLQIHEYKRKTNPCVNEVYWREKGSLERRYTDISGDTGQVENDEYHYGDIYNAGHYKVLLSADTMEGLAFDALDIQ